MEFKNKVVLEIVKEELPYRLELPAGAPLGDTYQVVGMFMDKIVELINEHREKVKKEEENAKEDERGEEEDKKSDEGI